MFSSSSEVEEISIKLTTRDPLSHARITVPARGINCKHLQCFDLSTYLQLNKNSPKFNCPVCSKPTPYEELVIDSYFDKFLKEITVDEAEVGPDGKWTIPDKSDKKLLKRKGPFESTAPIKKAHLPSNTLPMQPVAQITRPTAEDIIDLT
jgi:hypothetical protein